MSVQTTYNYSIQKGIAGGLYDIAPHAVVSKTTDEELNFGYGVVTGTSSNGVKLPTAATQEFEGVVVNGFTTQQTVDGKTVVEKGQTVGVMDTGNAWGIISADALIKAKKKVFLIVEGTNAGKFTTTEDTATKMELKAEFIGVSDDGLAAIRFYKA